MLADLLYTTHFPLTLRSTIPHLSVSCDLIFPSCDRFRFRFWFLHSLWTVCDFPWRNLFVVVYIVYVRDAKGVCFIAWRLSRRGYKSLAARPHVLLGNHFPSIRISVGTFSQRQRSLRLHTGGQQFTKVPARQIVQNNSTRKRRTAKKSTRSKRTLEKQTTRILKGFPIQPESSPKQTGPLKPKPEGTAWLLPRILHLLQHRAT